MNFELTPEQQALKAQVRRLADEQLAPIAAEIDDSDTVRWDVVALLRDSGLLAHTIPAEVGGQGLWSMNLCLIREELCRASGHADSLFTMQGLGSYPITLAGTPEQKQKYLPPVGRGEVLAAFGLSEPEAGSDAAGLLTTARRDGDRYLLNGMKRWISNAPEAGTYCVFAKTDPSAGARGVSCFIVERDTPGLRFGEPMKLMAPHPLGELYFEDAVVPAENLLGQEHQGFKLAMGTLDVFRCTVGAAAVGFGQGAFEASVAYAKRRHQFGAPLAALQAIQFKIADMALSLDAARLLVYRAATLRDEGRGQTRTTKEASMAKLFATEAAARIADEAVQIHGGQGVLRGNVVERFYREVRALRIYEGASEVQRVVIANQVLRA